MKINIELSKSVCDTILERCGYISENVTLYYDPMNSIRVDEAKPEELRGVQRVVCYPKGNRPEILSEEYPLIGECMDILYEKVIEDLFNSWLVKTMFMHEPY
jgi:hypothetical protein